MSKTPRKSSTFIYAPEVFVYIATDQGTIDISDDIIQGQVRRIVDGVSQFSCVLHNRFRKYQKAGMKPMDRITVLMKRTGAPRQVFSGYLDSVPAITLYSSTVQIRASCTLKLLQQSFWDPGLVASNKLLYMYSTQFAIQQNEDGSIDSDSGIGKIMHNVLTKIGNWDADQIAIGNIPSKLLNLAFEVDAVEQDPSIIDKLKVILGISTTYSGTGADTYSGPETVIDPTVYTPEQLGQVTYTISDLVAIGNAAGMKGDALFTAVACAFAESNGKIDFAEVYTPLDGVMYVRQGPWGVDSQYVPSITVRDARDPLKSARLFWDMTKQGKDFSVVHSYRSQEYKKWVAVAKDAYKDVAKSKAVSALQIPRKAINAPETPVTGPGLVGAIQSRDANNTNADSGTVPVFGANPKTEDLKKIFGESKEAVEANIVLMNFQGTQVKVHKKCVAAFAKVDSEITALGLPYKIKQASGFDYRTKNNGTGTDDLSTHAFGMTIDLNWDQNGFPKAGVGPNSTDIPKEWIQIFKNNGFIWGGDWTNPDYMHFQWTGGGTYSGTTEVNIRNVNDVQDTFRQGVFKFLYQGQTTEWLSQSLRGKLAPLNDVSLLPTIQTLCTASMRSFMSGPDGSFMAFYPDHFGLFGTKTKMTIEDIELINFSMDVSDDNLATDVFVSGGGSSPLIGEQEGSHKWILSAGVASITDPAVMKLVLGVDISSDPTYSPDNLYYRYGMRPMRVEYPNLVTGPNDEDDPSSQIQKVQAITLFMRKWAQQYATQVQLTFMPELYPGMRVLIRSHAITVYVEEVTHTFGFDSGFSTTATFSAPASVGSDVPGLPLGRL